MSTPPRTARPDTADYRDLLYVPSLVNVPAERPLDTYRRWRLPILNQGSEGACTGFGLAAVANYLQRTRAGGSGAVKRVSPRMLYEMAKRYDEWPGEDYDGSSCRAAIKGWHKHGVCSEDAWPYRDGDEIGDLTPDREVDARRHPLGAYFRVNSKDLVAMHAAMTEAGVLYVSAFTHVGWDRVGNDGRVPYRPGIEKDGGGHAICLVGYDSKGFHFQNSWGEGWGNNGFGHLSYNDWLAHGKDAWACRLGVAVSG